MNLKQAKQIPIMYFLQDILGLKGKRSANDILYHSPFREDDNPSYSVSIHKNISYDFATGEARDIIGVMTDYYDISVSEALSKLATLTEHTPPKVLGRYIPKEEVKRSYQGAKERKEQGNLLPNNQLLSASNRTQIKEIKDIFYFPLKNYIESRKIALETAKIYLKEIHYILKGGDRIYFGLTWQNISNGYEINRYSTTYKKSFKTAVGSKDISFILGISESSDVVLVFEGMFDFLSLLEYNQRKHFKEDVIILNSVSCCNKAIDFIQKKGYKEVFLYLDNDTEGKNAVQKFKKSLDINLNRGTREFSNNNLTTNFEPSFQSTKGNTFSLGDIIKSMMGITVIDKSGLYQQFKDVAEWWCAK